MQARLIDLDGRQRALQQADQEDGGGRPTAAQRRVAEKVVELETAENWRDLKDMDADALRTAGELREVVPQWAGTIYLSLCNCYGQLGQYADAIELNGKALAIFEELGDRTGQWATHIGLGNCYLMTRQYAEASKKFETVRKAWAILDAAAHEDTKLRKSYGTALSGLGNCKLANGDYPSAIDLFEQELPLVELGDCIGMGKTLIGLGSGYLGDGQHDKVKKMFEESLAIAEKMSDQAARGAVRTPAHEGLGRYYASRREYKNAIEHHQEALTIHREMRDRNGQGTSCNNLGDDLAKSGNFTAAADALVEGIVTWQEMEQDVGAHDDRRVSVFEEQQKTYRLLQGVLLGWGKEEEVEQVAGWALGVVAESKGRALAYAQRAGAGRPRRIA